MAFVNRKEALKVLRYNFGDNVEITEMKTLKGGKNLVRYRANGVDGAMTMGYEVVYEPYEEECVDPSLERAEILKAYILVLEAVMDGNDGCFIHETVIRSKGVEDALLAMQCDLKYTCDCSLVGVSWSGHTDQVKEVCMSLVSKEMMIVQSIICDRMASGYDRALFPAEYGPFWLSSSFRNWMKYLGWEVEPYEKGKPLEVYKKI